MSELLMHGLHGELIPRRRAMEMRPDAVLVQPWQGWLLKRHQRKSAWSRRYLVLDTRRGQIDCKWGPRSRSATSVPLKGALLHLVQDDGPVRNCFAVSCSPLQLVLSASSPAEKFCWVSCLYACIQLWEVYSDSNRFFKRAASMAEDEDCIENLDQRNTHQTLRCQDCTDAADAKQVRSSNAAPRAVANGKAQTRWPSNALMCSASTSSRVAVMPVLLNFAH